jgi:putative SOS response-associated peptidase YedK
MCGRAAVLRKDGTEIIAVEFHAKFNPDAWKIRNDLPPVAPIPVIRHVDAGSASAPAPSDQLELAELSWWLIPRFARERGRAPTFNARAETVARLPSFRASFRDRRCLIVVDGFYEWREKKDADRRRRFVRFADRRTFTLAGLWDRAVMAATGEEVDTCTIITTEANALLRAVPHTRMPVILDGAARARWLAPDATPAELQALLVPYPASDMEMLITNGAYVSDDDCVAVTVGPDDASI